jgi:hypothetical protein
MVGRLGTFNILLYIAGDPSYGKQLSRLFSITKSIHGELEAEILDKHN